jgi:palmitoyltransferase
MATVADPYTYAALRCVPKMDHHCPWTANCVSHITFPHFIRFVFYAVAAMSYLEYFLFGRARHLWSNRTLPSVRYPVERSPLSVLQAEAMSRQYLGPSLPQLIHLFILLMTNSVTLFALSTLLVRALWSLGVNTTTIEGWEIDRHQALVRRARLLGGYAYGPDGIKVRVKKQEFPYDIGIWKNVKQGMGGSWNVRFPDALTRFSQQSLALTSRDPDPLVVLALCSYSVHSVRRELRSQWL